MQHERQWSARMQHERQCSAGMQALTLESVMCSHAAHSLDMSVDLCSRQCSARMQHERQCSARMQHERQCSARMQALTLESVMCSLAAHSLDMSVDLCSRQCSHAA